VKPVPLMAAALIVSDAVPVELSVSDCVVAVFTATVPNDKLLELTPNVDTYAPSDKLNVCELLEVDAVSVAVCAVVTAVAVAVKLALVAPLAIWTDGGTVTAALLLARFTLMPPEGALPLTLTVHVSVAAPVNELEVQFNPDTEGRIVIVPVPVSATVSVPPLVAFDVKIRLPDSAALVVGSNCTLTVAV